MAVDHMLFDRLKWFNVADNADNVKANGRNYFAMPVSFTIPKDTHLSDGDHQQGFDLSKDCNVTCVGASDEFYYFCGEIEFTQSYGGPDSHKWDIENPQDIYEGGRDTFNSPMFIKKDKVKNIRWQ